MIENAVPQTPHTLSLDDGDVDVATRAGKNTMAQISMSAARMVSKFLFVLILARLAGRELLGDYTFIISFSTMFSALVSMGLVQSVVREVAKSPEQGTKMLGNALTITMMGVEERSTSSRSWRSLIVAGPRPRQPLPPPGRRFSRWGTTAPSPSLSL